MSIRKTLASHREIARNRRALSRAIEQASTPAMRDEIILIAQNHGNLFN